MRFYTKQHQFYCGIDLHADAMYVCILNAVGEIVVHKNIPTKPKAFLRLIKPAKESNGKSYGHSGKRIGNAHLRWAFGEAIILMLKGNKPMQQQVQKMANRHGKGKALAILSARLGRAVYDMLKNQVPFDQELFLRS